MINRCISCSSILRRSALIFESSSFRCSTGTNRTWVGLAIYWKLLILFLNSYEFHVIFFKHNIIAHFINMSFAHDELSSLLNNEQLFALNIFDLSGSAFELKFTRPYPAEFSRNLIAFEKIF